MPYSADLLIAFALASDVKFAGPNSLAAFVAGVSPEKNGDVLRLHTAISPSLSGEAMFVEHKPVTINERGLCHLTVYPTVECDPAEGRDMLLEFSKSVPLAPEHFPVQPEAA